MTYVVDLIINAPKAVVANRYIDKAHMMAWEKGLVRIEDSKGMLFREGSEGYLHFSFGEHHMAMKVTNEVVHVPDQIIQIYEVPGAWNRCDNRFEDLDHQTHWVMHVEFRFDEEPNIPVERFMEKTKAGMMMYKSYIEGLTL